MSTWTLGLFILLSGLLVYTGIRHTPFRRLEHLPSLPTPIWIALACGAFVGFRSAVHLLGDGDLLIRELDALVSLPKNEPLALWLFGTLHTLAQPFWQTAETTGRFYSGASGILYLFLCLQVARLLAKNRLEKALILGFLITPGFLQLFFGYIETYSLLFPAILLYLLVSFQALRQGRPVWIPAVLLGLLIPLHLTLVSFLPSLMVLLVLKARQDRRPNDLLISLCAPIVVSLLIFRALDFHPLAYLLEVRGSQFLPLLAQPDFSTPYRLLSPAHLLDFFNQQLLVVPSALLVLPLCFRTPRSRFLLTAAGFPLLLTFLGNPKIGAFRDWDALALPAVPLTLWAALALIARIQDPDRLARTGWLICGAAGLHTLFWIGLNASPTSAEARYTHLLNTSTLSTYARAFGYETLGTYHRNLDRPNRALEAYQKALDADPNHPRYWNFVGQCYFQDAQYQQALPYFQKAVEIKPDFFEALNNLGAVHIRLDDPKKAIAPLRKALEINPDFSAAHNSLAGAYYSLGQYPEAIDHFQKAIALNPKNTQAYYNLANLYGDLGQPGRKRQYYLKVLETNPDHPRSARIRQWLDDHP